jgi:predicted ATPase/signal transduction histidine kinase
MFIQSSAIFPIRGYQISQEIYLGSKTLVCRGIREKDQQPVIIKLMRNGSQTFSEIAQFRNQYTITKNLDLPGIVKPLSLENYGNGYILVMEDFGGISLKEEMRRWGLGLGTTLEGMDKFFPIAIQIASTLNELQRHRIIHKDIKPANIIINPTTLEVKLIDFSIASLLPKEIQFLTNPNFLEGTLAYISPEQTGRMNRGIDYRSDFYSLGITFFELLTGQLPFITTDPLELVYCHIAKQPPKVSTIDFNIPSIVSDIVNKLMKKNAEDRYQSALGLKYDLELCMQQWQKSRNIIPFQLGQHDISDCFLIPEKLYGRQHEVETLLAAFGRVASLQEMSVTGGTTEIILVTGASGIGKTAVVNEVHKAIERQHSSFIMGKFDQFQRDIPLSGLIQAFQDLIRQLLSQTDAQIQHWKAKILSVLGEQAQVIIDVIPQLEMILGKQPPITELSGMAAQNRFHVLFQRFINVFTTKDHSLILFLDDLQWADSASLQFIESLISQRNAFYKNNITPSFVVEENQGGLLLIVAYRNNISQSHPLYLALKEIQKTGVSINKISLEALNQGDLNRLIADTLRCSEAMAIPLTQMVFTKTKGNPFFTHQFLKYLHNEGIIQFNFDVCHWQCDIAKVKALTLTNNVVEFMAIQIEKLPKPTQEALKLAACIGSTFDLKALAIVHQKNEIDTAADLWISLIEGLVLPGFESYKLFIDIDKNEISASIDSQEHKELPNYKFVHDRVQQAAYSLISQNEKQSIHLKIGKLLLQKTPVEEQEEKIFEIVNQLNKALELITNQNERNELARMNWNAGCKAMLSTAYTAAFEYLTIGVQLLAKDSWETNYELTLALYEKAAEAAYLAGNFEQTEQFVEVVLTKAKTLLQKVKAYEVRIEAYKAQSLSGEAITTGLQVLKLFEIEFPEQPTQEDIEMVLQGIQFILKGKQIENLINLPQMSKPEKLAVMNILVRLLSITFVSHPLLFTLVVLEQINLSLNYGNCAASALSFATYAIIFSKISQDITYSYNLGQQALNLLKIFNAKEFQSIVIFAVNNFTTHWKLHIRESLKNFLEAYSIGLETGDLEQAAYSLYVYCEHSFWAGKEIAGLELEMACYQKEISQLKQEIPFQGNAINWQTVLNLLGRSENPCFLRGEAYEEQIMLPLLQQVNNKLAIFFINLNKLFLCYLFEDYQQAWQYTKLAEDYLEIVAGKFVFVIFYFYSSLTILAVYPEVIQFEQKQILEKVAANQERMKQWAEYAPMNFLHKYDLVEAERHRVLGHNVEAMELYDRAIALAKEHEYLHEEALALELAAKFYLKWGKQKIAQTYLTDAYQTYIRWGALAKVEDLKKRYRQLFAPLQQEQPRAHDSKSSTSECSPVSTSFNKSVVDTTNTTASDSLDLAAAIKASQAVSGEIEFEQLLSTLIQVVMENAGASKCALILRQSDSARNSSLTDDWQIAMSTVSSHGTSICTVLRSIPLDSSEDVPMTLINYVKRTQEIFVIDDVSKQPALVADRYILHQQPKSLLCIPIVNQRQLLGILYLENDLTTAVFTRDRIELLKLITTQAAISLENAMLYKSLIQANERLEEYSVSLEEKVAQRTQELKEKNQCLQQTLKELQSTQAQLIQSEKMSSLGQMVAGIAHEINNPVNFIYGNISHVSQYVQDLLDLLAVYQQENPNLTDTVKNKIQEIDLDFLAQDLPKLLDSMNVGSLRIRNIILSLRNFSRLDESEMKPVNIHEGIDNTLMILQHRLKSTNVYPEIEVIKEYGQLPKVNCYAGQLNQVFMNILSNAIDAIEQSFKEKKATDVDKGKIYIRTDFVNSNMLKIGISDNGIGMTHEVQQKIFDPFFTTKPIGSGTGLGLSISYQIVVDKHKGQLTCHSIPGQGTELIIQIPKK